MSLALYRRYRPSTFAEVVGQEHVTEPLRTALAAGRVNHAYLFSGPRGCGKTSSARIMARSLNCEQGPTPDPCGVCESCIALAPNGPGSLDVTEMDAASHNGVDDARELRDRAHYAPAHSRFRVFIIDEAHMITTQGFNALLKIVEEPPDHLVFVFATTEADKVLTTIRSRTHHYPFRLLPPSTLRGLLERICDDVGVRVEPAVYPLVVRAGGGSARDSLSVMDQLLAGAGDEGVTYERAVGLLGVTDVALLDDVVDALGAQDGPAVFGAVDRLVEAGHDPRRFASDLLQRLRDLILVQAVPDAGEKGLVDVPADELERMVDQATRLGPASLTRHAELVHTALTEMRGATAPRLLLELVCARMLLPGASPTDAALVQRLEGVERRLALGAAGAGSAGTPPDEPARYSRPSQRPETPAPTPTPPTPASSAPPTAPREPAPVAEPAAGPGSAPSTSAVGDAAPDEPTPAEREPTAPSTAGAIDAAGLRQVWPEVMNQVRERNKPTHALLQNATVTAVDGTTVTLSMPTPPLARQLGQPNRADHVTAALGAVLSGDWSIQAVHGGSAEAAPSSAPSRPAAANRPAPTRPSSNRSASERPGSERPGSERPAPDRPASDSPTPENGRTPGSRSTPEGHRTQDTGRPEPRRHDSQPASSESTPPERPAGRDRPRRPDPGPPEVPPPPEPPDEPEVTEEDMYAEAADDARGGVSTSRRDPDEAVMELLTQQLGARRVDGR